MIHSPSPRRPQPGLTAFTLVELLVVIGIIAILISIGLPLIHKVRVATYKADTQNEISQIMNACQQYYTTFNTYPGPFSNDAIETGTPKSVGGPITPGIAFETYDPTTTPPTYGTGSTWSVTGSENLVLGLMGGTRIDPSNNSAAFSPAEVGLGPLSLNPANPSRTASFFPTGSTYLIWTETATSNGTVPGAQYASYISTTGGTALSCVPFTDQAGNQSTDSPIPEFADRFPSPGPMPILYLRARKGAKGVVSDESVTDPQLNVLAHYQYDDRDFREYVVPPAGGNAIGLAPGHAHNLQNVGKIIKTAGTPPVYYSLLDPANKAPSNTGLYNAGIYFLNQSVTPTAPDTDADINYTGQPRAVDQFILISAGADGVYGTPDDITSFGDVLP